MARVRIDKRSLLGLQSRIKHGIINTAYCLYENGALGAFTAGGICMGERNICLYNGCPVPLKQQEVRPGE